MLLTNMFTYKKERFISFVQPYIHTYITHALLESRLNANGNKWIYNSYIPNDVADDDNKKRIKQRKKKITWSS